MTEPALEVEFCACGRPLHYTQPESEAFIRRQIEHFGPTVKIRTPEGAWYVPRHYVALHAISARRLPEVAKLHNWRKARYGE